MNAREMGSFWGQRFGLYLVQLAQGLGCSCSPRQEQLHMQACHVTPRLVISRCDFDLRNVLVEGISGVEMGLSHVNMARWHVLRHLS